MRDSCKSHWLALQDATNARVTLGKNPKLTFLVYLCETAMELK